MNYLLNFLKEYWFQIVTLTVAAIEVVFIFIKRKPKSVDDFILCLKDVLGDVPYLVSKVERPGEGDKKKSEVIEFALHLLSKKLGRGLSEFEVSNATDEIVEVLEDVLTAPTKKEITNEI